MGRVIGANLARTECHVWWARPAAVREDLDSLLTTDEQWQRARLARPDDQRRFTVARALARTVVGHYLRRSPHPLRFSARCKQCGGAHGKPRLPGTGIAVSWAHCGRWVVVAAARSAEVGIDVEAIPPADELHGLPGMVLSPDESRVLARWAPRERPAALLTYWTRKESVLKATADGLSVPLPALAVSAPDEPARVTGWTPASPARRVQLHDLVPGPGYVGALALLTHRCTHVVERNGERLLDASPWNRPAAGQERAARRPMPDRPV